MNTNLSMNTHASALLAVVILIFSCPAKAECSDYNAKAASNKATEAFMHGKVFREAVVLKVHRPSKTKEVASYIKAGDLYYTVFTLVNTKCQVGIIKRTNGKY